MSIKDTLNYFERLEQSQKLKIVCFSIGEIGHLMPMSYIASALVERGHDVHYVTNGHEYARQKAKTLLEPIEGLNIHFVMDELARERFFEKGGGDKALKEFEPHAKQAVIDLQPQIVVCDYASYIAALAADEMGIPCVINIPGPATFIQQQTMMKFPNMKNASMCCGAICLKQTWMACFVKFYLSFVMEKKLANYWSTFNSRTILINSFLGLDQATSVPPNFIYTGPLVPAQEDLMPTLAKKDEALFNWLNEAEENGITVAYVSLGSICKWQKWSIDATFYGLKKAGYRVVWSLKDWQLPEEDPNFWVSSWVPQVEVLNHPAVKVGLTHCGWGGVLEFISSGTPVVAFPHFGDQPGNAKLLIDAKCGVMLYNYNCGEVKDLYKATTVVNPSFTADKVCKVFQEASQLVPNMKNMQVISQLTGGRNLAAKAIEQTYITKGEQLIDHDLIKMIGRQNACQFLYFKCFVVAFIAAFIWLAYNYYITNYE